jgi:hypothetical protein
MFDPKRSRLGKVRMFSFALAKHRPRQAKPNHYNFPIHNSASFNGSSLYFGGRSLFGTIVLAGLTIPTRSRAIARTSFGPLNFFGFFFTRTPYA